MRLKLEVTLKLEMTSKVATELRLNLKLQTEMTREMFKTGRDQGAEEDGVRKKNTVETSRNRLAAHMFCNCDRHSNFHLSFLRVNKRNTDG